MSIVPVHSTKIGQVQDGTTMTSVDDGMELGSVRERPYDCSIDLVVHDDTRGRVVHREKSLVKTIDLVAAVVHLVVAMTGKMENKGISRFAA